MRWICALLLLPLAVAAQGAPGEPCSVSGVVSNAATGEPVRRALVYLRRVDSSPGVTNIQVAQTASTNAAGQYAMSGIAPGKYRLSAERSGFITAQYGARGPGKAGTLLTLDAGQTSRDLGMRLTPHGVIAGRVYDEESEPVPNAEVQILRQQYIQGRKQLARTNGASTNDLGEYRVFGLPPGKYFVSAAPRQNSALPPADEEYVATYFPRVTDSSMAAPIDVAAGAQLRNIDIPLAKVHTVTLRGRAISEVPPPPAGDNAPRKFLSVMLSQRHGGGITRGAPVNPQGTFELRSVPPGSYILAAAMNSPGRTLTARMPVQVGNSNVEGILLTVRGGVPVSGRVRVEGDAAANPAQTRVTLLPAEPAVMMFGPMPTQQVKPDGSFQMSNVGADRYLVSVTGLPEGFYVKSIRSANLDVLAAGLDIAENPPAPLDVLLSPRAGQVSGTVTDPGTQKPAVSMTAVLVPQEKERRDREAFYQTFTTDQAGRFAFRTVVPGEYRIYAWEDVEPGAWMDPDFLKPFESRGEAVSVAEGGSYTLQVTLISPEAR